MRLQRIQLSGFKGIDRTIELGTLTFITGPNGIGKSTILQGIQYAIQGTVPDGATNEAAMRYMGPNGGAVQIECDNGLAVRRGIIREGDKLATDISVSTMPGAGVRAAEAEVSRVFGDFAEMFNLGVFFSMSADKRRDFVLELCGGAVTSDFDVLGEVRTAYLQGRSQLSEDEDSALEEILSDFSTYSKGVNVADSIAKVLDRAKTQISFAKGAAERARQASLEISARKNEIRVVATSVEEFQRRRTQAVAEREALLARINQHRGKEEAIDSLRRTLARRQDELATARKELARVSAVKFKVEQAAEWEAQAAEQDAAAGIPAPPVRPDTREIAIAIGEHGARIRKWETEACRLDAQIAGLDLKIEAIENSAWTDALELLEKLFQAGRHVDIPPMWEAHHNLRRFMEGQRGGDTEALTSERTDLCGKLTVAKRELDFARTDAESAQKRCDALESSWRDANTAYAARIQDARKASESAADARRKAKAITDGVADQKRTTARLDASIEGLEKAVTDTEAEIQRLASDLGADDRTGMDEVIGGLDREIADLDANIKAKAGYDTLSKELDRLKVDLRRQQTRHDVAKDLADAVRVSRETFMSALIRPLLTRVGEFLSGSGLPVEPFCDLETDRGKPILELGWVHSGTRRVGLSTMSGGEFALFGAALSFAMVQLRNPPLRLLMIEAGELDTPSTERLLDAIEAVAGSIDNAIVAHWSKRFDTTFSVVDLERVSE